MADKKISELTAAAALTGAEEVPIVQSAATVKATVGAMQIGATNVNAAATGAITLDFSAYRNFVLTMTGDVTLSNPTTEAIGQAGFITLIQDATGSRTLSLSSEFLTAGASGITLSTTGSAIDVVPYIVVGAGQILLGNPQLAFG